MLFPGIHLSLQLAMCTFITSARLGDIVSDLYYRCTYYSQWYRSKLVGREAARSL